MMELSLEVLASASIKRKKPWPKMAWLGEGGSTMGLYLLDYWRISQLSPSTGKTKKTFPSLASIDSRIILTCHSSNGAFLAGITTFGDVFTWHEHTQELWTYISPLSGQETNKRGDDDNLAVLRACKLFVADSGVLGALIVRQSEVYLWRVGEGRVPQWWKVSVSAVLVWPLPPEMGVQVCFYGHQELGDCCSIAFVHTNHGTSETVLSHLLIQWYSPHQVSITHTLPSSLSGHTLVTASKLTFYNDRFQPALNPVLDPAQGLVLDPATPIAPVIRGNVLANEMPPPSFPSSNVTHDAELAGAVSEPSGLQDAVPFQASWKATPVSLCQAPPLRKGGYRMAFCPTGSVLALAVNCPNADDSVVFFFSLLTEVGLPVTMYAGKKQKKDRMGRTYWIADMAWTADGLFLACINKRGSVLIMPRFGHPVLLTTHGCSLDMGPAPSLPLHPLITVISTDKMMTTHETSESSERDALRQRFSVSTHPFSPTFICSDGYCFTVLKLTSPSLPNIVTSLTNVARSVLGLVPLEVAAEQFNTSTGGEDRDGALGSASCLGATQNIATREPDNALEGTLGGTLGASGRGGTWGPLDPALLNREGGVIHFADVVDGDLDPTLTLTGGASLVRCAGFSMSSVTKALPDLYSAWALLLSCGPLEAGNGAYPSSKFYSNSQVGRLRMALVRSSVLAVSTLASVVGFLCTSKGKEWEDVVDTCLELLGLDSLEHARFAHSSLLANALAQVIVSHTLTLHGRMRALLCSKLDFQMLLDLVGSVGNGVDTITRCLQWVLSSLESTYSPAPYLVGTDMRFLSSIPLSSSLFSAGKLLTILLDDLRLCRARMKQWKSRRKEPMVLKWGGLYRRVRAGIRSSASSVHNLFDAIARLLGPSVSALGMPISWNDKASKPCCHGNPITLSNDAVSSSLSALYRRLESYDFKCALEIGSSHLFPREAWGSLGLVPSTSLAKGVGQSSGVSLTGTTGFERIVSDAERMSNKVGVLTEAGAAVLVSLSRFMAAFFCNQRLLIFPASHPHILPPSSWHVTPPVSVPCGASWNLELDRSSVTRALSEQGVSSLWSPDYAVQLMLLCGLWEEACEFLSAVGEWKKGLLVAATCYSLWHRLDLQHQRDAIKKLSCEIVEGVLLSSLLVSVVPPSVISGAESSGGGSRVLGLGNQTPKELFRLVSSTINVCALVGFDDVIQALCTKLTGQLVAVCTRLPLEVPASCPLPSPPLFMLQPGVEEEVYFQCPSEFDLRNTLVTLTQNVLLVLRAANCLLPCVQWYACMLRGLHTGPTQPLCVPERDVTLSHKPPSPGSFLKDFNMDCCCFSQDTCDQSSEVKVMLSALRELCAMHWMLHVRDEAFLHMRRLRSPWSVTKSPNLQKDPAITERAAQWTARLLPFASLLSRAENSDIDHMLLALLAELPCDSYLADLAAFYYPSAPSTPESLAGRFDRFMAKLRSQGAGPSHVPQFPEGVSLRSPEVECGDPISVRYHIQSQHVLAKQQQFGVSLTFKSSVRQTLDAASERRAATDREATSGMKAHLKDEILASHAISSLPKSAPASSGKLNSGKGENLHTGTATTGSFLFEHDREYIRFVDTFFELILSGDAHSVLEYSPCGLGISPQGQGVELDQPPFLGMYWNTMSNDVDTTRPCWAQVVPLVSLLHEWTQAQSCDLSSFGAGTSAASVGGPVRKPEGTVMGGLKATAATHPRSRSRKQGKRPIMAKTPVSLLVNIPAGQLVHALKLEEGRRGSIRQGGSLERVTSQDQVCQEEEREKYLQTLRSLEVWNDLAAPPSGGDEDQDGGLGEQDDISVSSATSGAPISVHTSRVRDEHQKAEDAQQLSLSPPVPDEPVVPCREGGSGGVGGTSPYLHHGPTHALQMPLLQVPPDTLKGTIPIHSVYPWAVCRPVVSKDRNGVTGASTTSEALVELSAVEDDSRLLSVGELPQSATLSVGEVESDTLSMTDLYLDQTGGDKLGHGEEEHEGQGSHIREKAGVVSMTTLLGMTAIKAGKEHSSSHSRAAAAIQVVQLGASSHQELRPSCSAVSNCGDLQNSTGGRSEQQTVHVGHSPRYLDLNSKGPNAATNNATCPAVCHESSVDRSTVYHGCDHAHDCRDQTNVHASMVAAKYAAFDKDEHSSDTDCTTVDPAQNGSVDAVKCGASLDHALLISGTLNCTAGSKQLEERVPCDLEEHLSCSILQRPSEEMGACDPLGAQGSTLRDRPLAASVNSTLPHPVTSTTTDAFPDHGERTQPVAFPENGMTEIKMLLQLQHQYLMKVLDMSAANAHPVKQKHNGRRFRATREAPGTQSQLEHAQPSSNIQLTTDAHVTASSHDRAPLVTQERHTSDPPGHSHLRTSAPNSAEIQKTDSSSKSLSLLDLVCPNSLTSDDYSQLERKSCQETNNGSNDGKGLGVLRADSVPTGGLGMGTPFLLQLPQEHEPLLQPPPSLPHHTAHGSQNELDLNSHFHTYPLLTINYESVEPNCLSFPPPPLPPPPPPPPPPPSLPHLPFPLLRVDHQGVAPHLPLLSVAGPLPPNPLPVLIPPTHHNNDHPVGSVAPELRLPSVPMRPFVPRLIDPRVMSSGTVPYLLQLGDPLSQLQRRGFPLLHIPPVANGGKGSLAWEPQHSSLIGSGTRAPGVVADGYFHHVPAHPAEDSGESGGVQRMKRSSERKHRVRSRKASGMKRHLNRKQRVSWQSSQSFEADCDDASLSSPSSHSSLHASEQHPVLQAPPIGPSQPQLAQNVTSQQHGPQANPPPQLQAPPTEPSQPQAPPTKPSQPQAPPTGPSQPHPLLPVLPHLQMLPTGSSEKPIPCTNVLLDSLEVRRRDKGATYFMSSTEYCGNETKVAGTESIRTKVADTGTNTADEDRGVNVPSRAEPGYAPPVGQTTEGLTTPPIESSSTRLLHNSEHTNLPNVSQSTISSTKSVLMQQEHSGQIDKGPGSLVSQHVEEVTPSHATSTNQSDKGVGSSGKLPDPHMQCTLDNPPPMLFTHVATTGDVGDKPTQTQLLPVALHVVSSSLLPQLEPTSGHSIHVPTPICVTLAPESVMPAPIPSGAVPAPGGVVPTPVAVIGAETQCALQVEMNYEPCCRPGVENIEPTVGGSGAGVLASFGKIIAASKNELGTDRGEPGTTVSTTSAILPRSNGTQLLAAPERLTRLLIGETWTRVPFGSSTGPIGVIRDSNDFLKKLKTLDDQLCAIEATAETMAGDLKASNHLLSTINNLQGICDVSAPMSAGATVRKVSALLSPDSAAPGMVYDVCVEVVPLQGSRATKSSEQSKREAPSVESEEQVELPFTYGVSQQHVGMEASGNDLNRFSNGLHNVFGEASSKSKTGICEMPKGGTKKLEAVSRDGTKKVETSPRLETKPLRRDGTMSSKGAVPAGGMKRKAGMEKSKGLPLKTSGNAKISVLNSKNVKEAVGTAEKTSWKPVKTCSRMEGHSESVIAFDSKRELPVEGNPSSHPAEEQTAKPNTKGKHPYTKPRQPSPQLSTQWKEFHARRVEDALVLMADIMSSKPQQTSMQKSAVLSRPPLGSREKNLVMQQTVTALQPQTTLGGTFGENSSERSHDMSLLTTKKRTSTTEGLSQKEQQKIAEIMASMEYEGSSVSSESVAASIDWEQVDKLLAV